MEEVRASPLKNAIPRTHAMKGTNRYLLPLAILLLSFLAFGAAPVDDAGRIQRGVPVSMRDGVKLIVDVYLPPGNGRWPVILIRTPYNRATGEGAARPFRAHYAVVVQDT